jgi:hypothetical protein
MFFGTVVTGRELWGFEESGVYFHFRVSGQVYRGELQPRAQTVKKY